MINDELLSYIRKQRTRGVRDADIRKPLKEEGGWADVDIDEAFDTLDAGEESASKTSTSSDAEAAAGDVDTESNKENKEEDSNTKTDQDTRQMPSDIGNFVSDDAGADMDRTDGGAKKEEKGGAMKKIVIGGLIILVLLLAGGGGAYAYVKYFSGPSADEILNQAIVYTASSSDALSAGSMESTIASAENSSEIGINTAFSRKNEDPRFEFALDLKDISAPNSGSMKFSANGSVVYAENALYAKISNVPSIPFVPAGVIDAVTEKWVRVDSSSLQELSSSTDMLPGGIRLMNVDASAIEKMQQILKRETDKIQERLQEPIEQYQEYSFITVKNELEEATVNGVTAHHYELAINEKDFAAWWDAYGNKVTSELSGQMENDLTNAKEFMSKVFKPAANSIEGEVWIAQDQPRILRVNLEAEVNIKKYLENYSELKPEGGFNSFSNISTDDLPFGETVTMTVRINLNDAVSITAPTPSTSIHEVVKEVKSSLDDSPFGGMESELNGGDSQFPSTGSLQDGSGSFEFSDDGQVRGANTVGFQQRLQKAVDEWVNASEY